MSLSFGQAIIGGLLFTLLLHLYKYIIHNTSDEPTVRVPTIRVPTVRDRNADNNIIMKYNQEKQWRTETFSQVLDENCDMDILSLFYNRQFM